MGDVALELLLGGCFGGELGFEAGDFLATDFVLLL